MLTGRAHLARPCRADDLPLLHAWINDRELVVLSAPYRPVHFSDHEAWWASVSSDPSVELFAIRLLDDDRLVGTCQLLAIDHRHRSAELQIRIGEPDARGRGLGTEAVGLLLRHAFADLDLRRVSLHVLASNAPAIAAYEKSGFVREGVLREAAYIDGRREDVVVMSVLAERVAADEPPDELAQALVALQAAKDEATRERWNRSLPLAEELFDRWERARRLGFGDGASIYHQAYVYGDVTRRRATRGSGR